MRDNDKVLGEANTSHQQDGLHGKNYKDKIFDRLDGKSKKDFKKELKQIKKNYTTDGLGKQKLQKN